MDWKNEMLKAMEMLANACSKNESWRECRNCPFTVCCDAIWNGVERETMDIVITHQINKFIPEENKKILDKFPDVC